MSLGANGMNHLNTTEMNALDTSEINAGKVNALSLP